jgi:hypothetical protein
MSENATPAAAAPITEKRAIRMAEFNSKEAQAAATLGNKTSLGQIVGIAYSTMEKVSTLADGSGKSSTLLLGQFEAVNFKTGEVMQSGAAYLPQYFADQIKAQIDAAKGGVSFAIEIVLEPNPRENAGIKFQYAVSNLLPPSPNDPLQELKRRAMGSGRLRLTATAAPAATQQIEGTAETPPPAEDTDAASGGSKEGATPSAPAKGKGK